MNRFHWHLTDDQGWRIEIKKYPELMTTGAYRNGTLIGRYPGTTNNNLRYGGFYTQDEVKEVVAYAAERAITVVPEIEMPGHGSAAIAAYPWLSCFPDKPTNMPTIPSERSTLRQAQGDKKMVQETWGCLKIFSAQAKTARSRSCKTCWTRCCRCFLQIHPHRRRRSTERPLENLSRLPGKNQA